MKEGSTMKENIFKKISDYIINEVSQNSESSMSGFQYCVSYADIQELYAVEIEEFVNNMILKELENSGKVADIILDTDGFDVVLYTDYAENYDEENYEDD